MNNLIIGVAQLSVVKGDIAQNLERHCQLIKVAAENNVNVLLFPELSLTGYEPFLAKDLAIDVYDNNLLKLQELAVQYSMTLLVGAPKKMKNKPEIGLFIIHPNDHIVCYSKMNLHESEELFFASGLQYQTLDFGNQKIGLAICADIANPAHVDTMMQGSINFYLTSALISSTGLDNDCNILKNYALKHNIVVAMANFTGETGGWECAGNSTIWDEGGEVIACAGNEKFVLAIAHQENSKWLGQTIVID